MEIDLPIIFDQISDAEQASYIARGLVSFPDPSGNETTKKPGGRLRT